MASAEQQEPPVSGRESSSSDTHSPPPSLQRRQSSIRFSQDTSTVSRFPMSRRWRDSSDEITPIRTADRTEGRNYNTTEDEAPAAIRACSPKRPSHDSPEADESKENGNTWYRRIAEKYGSISLDNKGSVARDHLALERTFLAWLRTSLAFASIGIAVTQLFRLNTTIANRSQSYTASVPFSPLLGQSMPADLLPYLQQAATQATASMPTLGPTLLDQLLLLPPRTGETYDLPAHKRDFDEQAAARLRHVGKPLGATFLGISVVILFIGFHRYFESQHWIIRGKFPASRGSIFLVGFLAASLIISSLVVVLVIAPTRFEKK